MNHEQFDIAIVGGGPAGMMTALSINYFCLKNQKPLPTIIIAEQRGEQRTRSNTLLLDEAPIFALEQFGCDLSTLTPANDFTQIFPDQGIMNQYPLGTYCRPVSKTNITYSALFMLRRKPVFNVSINELERILIAKLAESDNIELSFESVLAKIKTDELGVQLVMETAAETRHINSKFAVAADGTHSQALNLLGIDNAARAQKLETVISANFTQPGIGNTKYQTNDRSFEVLSLASRQGSSVFVKIERDSEFSGLSLDIAVERERLVSLLKRGASKLGVRGEIGAGLSVLEVNVNEAPASIIDNRVFVVGDARHSGTPRVGLGVNVAFMDAIRAGKSLERALFGTPTSRYFALQGFKFHTWLGTRVFSFLSRATNTKPRSGEVVEHAAGAFWNFWKGQLLMSFHWRAGKGKSWNYKESEPQEAFSRIRLTN